MNTATGRHPTGRPATLRAAAVGVALSAILAGCTGGGPGDPGGGPVTSASAGNGGPGIPALRLTAALAPCPVAGGAGPANDGLPHRVLPCLGTGPAVRLDALTGIPTLVNIWGSWCVPCQQEVPYLQAVYASAAGRLRVLGVDTEDSTGSALDFAAHAGMHYPSVVDNAGSVLRAFGTGPPITLLVDTDGRVVFVHRGPYESVAAVRADLDAHLGLRW